VAAAKEMQDPAHRNDVVLVGRLAAPADERELPSGDRLVSFRVVVGRPDVRPAVEGVRRTTVDALECTAWRADVRRSALAWQPGDVVEVTGALRRRFWRAGGGPASRVEVEVARARRVRRAGR
jgi:single-strand DNA-binding protein